MAATGIAETRGKTGQFSTLRRTSSARMGTIKPSTTGGRAALILGLLKPLVRLSRPMLRALAASRKGGSMSALDEVSDQPVSLEDLLEARKGTSQNLPKPPTFENLSEKKRAAVELLALGTSYTATAKAVGVDRRTIFEWRQDELCLSE